MRQIIHAFLSIDWYRLKGWQTTVALKRDWRLRTSTVLRCVRNPANPSGMRHIPSFLTRHVGSNIPRTASVEAKAGPKPEVETETSTRAKGCCARREGRRLRGGKRPTRGYRVHRSVLNFPLWSEWNRFLRKSKHFVHPPPNIAISSASQFAEHSTTSGMLPIPMIGNVVLEIEI